MCWPFSDHITCSSDLKNVANSRPLASNFRRSLEQFFLTVSRSEQSLKQNTISVRKHKKSCFASHFEFVVSYAITITILAYLLASLSKALQWNYFWESTYVFFFQNMFQPSSGKLKKIIVKMLIHLMKIQL